MLTLLSTNEAASKLGISVQGVHYRIKTKKLKSIVKDGKTFVYVELDDTPQENPQPKNELHQELIKVKDEQISLLKRAIRWMGFQHKQEIERMEQTNNKLIDVFKSEVELLQRAYNEMQTLYRTQSIISYKNQEKTPPQKQPSSTISIEEFFLLMKRKGKNTKEIKQILFNSIKYGDKRFDYSPFNKKITIANDDFKDIL